MATVVTVADVMTSDVVSVGQQTPFKDVVTSLRDHGISAVPVLDATGRPVGVVSEADLLVKERYREHSRAFGAVPLRGRSRLIRRATATTAGEVMTARVKTVGPGVPLSMAVRRLLTENLRRLFVVDEHGRLVGVLARRDVLLRVFSRSDEELAGTVRHDVLRFALWAAPDEVSVRVSDGEVTLEGELDRRSEVERAGLLTAQIPGVVAVHNRLTYSVDDVSAARA